MKKIKYLIIALVAIAIILVAGYFTLFSKTKASTIFNSKIEETIKNLGNTGAYNSLTTKVSLSAGIETEKNEYKDLENLLNKLKFTINSETDYKQKTQYFGLDAIYEDEEFIKGNVYYADGDDNIYFYLNGLWDRYLKMNLKDIDHDGEIRKSLNVFFNSTSKKEIISKVKKILNSEIQGKLKEEYFKQETVEDKKKSTLKLTIAELRTIIKEICDNLQKNEEFLSCYDNPTEIKDTLADLVDGIDKGTKEYDEIVFEVSLYTKGMFANEIVKIEISLKKGEDNNVTFSMNKVNDENYEFNVNIKTNENNMTASIDTFNGTLKIEKNSNNERKYILNANVPDIGKVTLNMEVSRSENKELEKVDVSNSVDINNLTEEDSQKMAANLQKMPIFNLLIYFMGGH